MSLIQKNLAVLETEVDLPEPVMFDPPQNPEEAIVYKESLEGMLVGLKDTAVAVAPTTKYGEYALVYLDWDVDTVHRGQEAGFLVFVDDGSTAVHNDQSTLPYVVQRGDQLIDLVGPLAYTFGLHKIEPITIPKIESAERPLPLLPEPTANQFSVATFNVQNFFDRYDPTPQIRPYPTKVNMNKNWQSWPMLSSAPAPPHSLACKKWKTLAFSKIWQPMNY